MPSRRDDIRLHYGCPDHPKIEKLERRAGPTAFRCLIRFWCWVAQHHPDGSLAGLKSEDVEIAARWTGEAGTFSSSLSVCGLLDGSEPEWSVHGWDENQPFVANFKKYSEAGIKANRIRWGSESDPNRNPPFPSLPILSNPEEEKKKATAKPPSPRSALVSLVHRLTGTGVRSCAAQVSALEEAGMSLEEVASHGERARGMNAWKWKDTVLAIHQRNGHGTGLDPHMA